MSYDERAATANDRRIGQRVRSRRLEIGMSQERLAELLGVTFQQVQKYEKGVNRIAASRLFDISIALELDVGAFFEGLTKSDGTEAPRTAASVIHTDAASAELNRIFSTLRTPIIRKRVVGLVRAVADEETKKS